MEISDYIKNLYNFSDGYDKIEKLILNLAKSENIPHLNQEKAELLSFIVKLKNPENSLEIGLGSGFSTYKILKELDDNGKLISLDFNFFRIDNFFYNVYHKLPLILQEKLTVYPGDGFYFIEKFIEIEKKFDFIFLDATKRDYLEYYKILPQILNVKGILYIDNISYCKQIFRLETDRSKKYLEGIKSIEIANKKLLQMKNFKTVFLPIHDGVALSIKLQD